MRMKLGFFAATLAVSFVSAMTTSDTFAADLQQGAKKPASVVYKTTKKRPTGKQSRRNKVVSEDDLSALALSSSAVMVTDQITGAVIYEKNSQAVLPIASITKLMTAMVSLDAQPDLSEILTVSAEDVDMLKGTTSRLRVGAQLTREEMLNIALMSSENRAASSLSRHYPGGRDAFVAAMNRKAKELDLRDTRFEDATGLTKANVSSPRDLAKMVDAAYQYPLIREFSTSANGEVTVSGRSMQYNNTNSLVKSSAWDIGLSKTGYIREAGKCLVMQAWLDQKPVIIVLLDSWGKLTRVADANRIKRWVEHSKTRRQI
jgi:D-alanyl-D-alanine endopeptidase (penicillin-binding protein 7)